MARQLFLINITIKMIFPVHRIDNRNFIFTFYILILKKNKYLFAIFR